MPQSKSLFVIPESIIKLLSYRWPGYLCLQRSASLLWNNGLRNTPPAAGGLSAHRNMPRQLYFIICIYPPSIWAIPFNNYLICGACVPHYQSQFCTLSFWPPTLPSCTSSGDYRVLGALNGKDLPEALSWYHPYRCPVPYLSPHELNLGPLYKDLITKALRILANSLI